jgi:hypothetical protein
MSNFLLNFGDIVVRVLEICEIARQRGQRRRLASFSGVLTNLLDGNYLLGLIMHPK